MYQLRHCCAALPDISKEDNVMKDVLKAIIVVTAVIGICAAALTVLNKAGMLRRRYLTVEEN